MDRNGKRSHRVAAFLEMETTLALATAASDGDPRITALLYLPQAGLHLYWFFPPRAIKAGTSRGIGARRRNITMAYAESFRLGKSFQARMSKSALYCFSRTGSASSTVAGASATSLSFVCRSCTKIDLAAADAVFLEYRTKWRGSQVVRPGSAKPLFVGSIPTRASNHRPSKSY